MAKTTDRQPVQAALHAHGEALDDLQSALSDLEMATMAAMPPGQKHLKANYPDDAAPVHADTDCSLIWTIQDLTARVQALKMLTDEIAANLQV